ncbi:MAG: glycosyltransferase family 9 protein [Candidatus Aegiribacteria sp.]|nr:glycosyltransferase family 9 protein [Candidatus Aegiribacteria sp.]
MALLKRIERRGRKYLSGMLCAVLTSGRNTELPSDPSRILVIRTDNRLGNLVLLEPLLRSIRERFPEAYLEILASDVFSELLESQGYSVIGVDKKGQIRNPWKFVRLVRELRKSSYDVAIDAAHPHSFSLSGAVSAAMSGSECRISTSTGKNNDGWFTHTVPAPLLEWHESRALHSLGSVWDKWPSWSPPLLRSLQSEKRDAVGLHVGANGIKQYPPDLMEKLVEMISDRIHLELYWGNLEEKDTAEYLGRNYDAEVMPELTVTGMIDRIAGLKAFVSADNGPMHVASALSVPVIALFRVDNQERFAPLSDGSEVLYAPEGADPAEVIDIIENAIII